MNIVIGSTNIIKIQAVEEVVKTYSFLDKATFHSISVPSDVSEQPLTIDEIIAGAKNRSLNAHRAYKDCKYSFGLESGLFKAEGTQTGYLEACICAIYDGTHFHTGLSCGFEIPPHVLQLILQKNLNLNDACYESGVTTNARLGTAEGFVGMLTKGRINRKEYTKQSVIMAMAQIEHAHWYTQPKANLQLPNLG